eukprot:2956202-Pleurochrysis_carterae.AAC.1
MHLKRDGVRRADVQHIGGSKQSAACACVEQLTYRTNATQERASAEAKRLNWRGEDDTSHRASAARTGNVRLVA